MGFDNPIGTTCAQILAFCVMTSSLLINFFARSKYCLDIECNEMKRLKIFSTEPH